MRKENLKYSKYRELKIRFNSMWIQRGNQDNEVDIIGDKCMFKEWKNFSDMWIGLVME